MEKVAANDSRILICCLGFDIYDVKNPEQLALQHRWQQRCSRYLGFLLDGHLLGNKLKLSDIADTIGSLGVQGDQVSDVLIFVSYCPTF